MDEQDRNNRSLDRPSHSEESASGSRSRSIVDGLSRDEGPLSQPDAPLNNPLNNPSNTASDVESTQPTDLTFQQSPVGMFHLSAQGILLRVNQEFISQLGHPSEKLIDAPFANIVHKEDSSQFLRSVDRIASGKTTTFTLEQRLVRSDDSWIWTQLSLAIGPVGQGPAYLLGVVTDITRQKQAEILLRKSNQRLATVVSNAPIVLWAVDRDGVFTVSQGKALERLNIAPDSVIGKSVYDLYSDAPHIVDDIQRALRGETFTSTIEVADSVFESNFLPICGENGDVLGALGVSTDVTARVRFEEALKYRIEFGRLISKIASNFINLTAERTDAGIQQAIDRIGRFCKVDRSYVLFLKEASQTIDDAHEWCAETVGPHAESLRGCDLDQIWPNLAATICQGEVVHQTNLPQMPPEMAVEKTHFEDYGVQSVLIVPMMAGSKPSGLLVFETVRRKTTWSDDSISLLQMVGEVFSKAVQHKHDKQALLQIHQQLDARVKQRTAELSRANESLVREVGQRRSVEQQLRDGQRLMEQTLIAHERDRQLMAYEIHDGIVQDITGTLMHFEAYRDRYVPESLAPDGAVSENDAVLGTPRRSFDCNLDLLRRTIDEARRLISGLRPPILDERGIVAAIEYLLDEQSGDENLRIEFHHDIRFDRVSPLLEGALFRIVQEAVTNIKRHSQAKRARINLTHAENRVRLVVQDWGVGFDPQGVVEHRFGLQGIRERARLLRGQAAIESTPGEGTRIVVDLPITHALQYANPLE